LKKYFYVLFSGLLSGIFIGIGVTVFLSTLPYNKVLGSFLFGFGLYCVIIFESFLYTGKAGFILDNKPKYLIDLLIGLIGNFIGVFLICALILTTRYGNNLSESARLLVDTKLNDDPFSIFVLSIFCGFMIYLAVVGHNKCENPFGKVIISFLAIVIFILCGFEHCVANCGYFTYAGVFSLKGIGYILLMVIGNGVGSVILDGTIKLVLKFKENKEQIKE